MHFHGVGAEGREANVFGATDLDSLWVELKIMDHRTAKNVKTFVRETVSFSVGYPPLVCILTTHAS